MITSFSNDFIGDTATLAIFNILDASSNMYILNTSRSECIIDFANAPSVTKMLRDNLSVTLSFYVDLLLESVSAESVPPVTVFLS